MPFENTRDKGTAQPYRSSAIRDGITFDHVEALWRFDRKLRLLCLDAIETVEIGLRSRLAYLLGQRDPLGHGHRDSLKQGLAVTSELPV